MSISYNNKQKQESLFNQIENKAVAKILSRFQSIIILNNDKVNEINRAAYEADNTLKDISWPGNYKKYIDAILKIFSLGELDKVKLQREFGVPTPNDSAGSYKIYYQVNSGSPKPKELFNQIENKAIAKILSNFSPPIILNQKQVEEINNAGQNPDKTPKDISSPENYKSYVTDVIKAIYPNQSTMSNQKHILSRELHSFKASFLIIKEASQSKEVSNKMNVVPNLGGLFNQIENRALAKILSSFTPPITLSEQQVHNINTITKNCGNITTTDGFRRYLDQIRKECLISKEPDKVDKFHKAFGLDSDRPGMSQQHTAIIFENFRIQKEQNSSAAGNQPLTEKKIDPEEEQTLNLDRRTPRI